ncbi:MAG: demethoxyubiquinone hydroxylase family protein [Pelagibacteraceae bacterium]|jgi:ubiquinone biosynthesis monooxygenase Coq7|nr:demethoxyubiquinone hydroxylase family protein [Pelagibacteraceae bacterium]MBT4645398.1 demethoxyubiquinone hydroxylase family protein [Pelagibacteraceae bacterium]MBT4951635.1 demethoxyubiquinone hydroxylase family protein [Pelagibacteraceae bacterium]MBT6354824.1 demethoxyubiquinone hydroxylase family protein [Pelagibacteraceae bacterium]
MVQKKKKLIKKKPVKKNNVNKKSKASTDKNILDQIIRVDHAGEYGATRIYDGQIAIFGKESKIGKTIQHMADQEQEHIEKFNELIIEKRVRPTALLPLWNVAGFALGAGTALMGEKAAMACTVAVEKVIGDHYREQQNLLEDDEKELKKTIAKFEKDELEHHDIGLEHDAESAPGYKIMTKVIELGCKTAIAISKKI